ncbi:preQ(1) synthase [bacterium]|nr:preQ(1) synthase [bacterium]
MSTLPQNYIDTFENPNPERNYEIIIDTPEFTCLCPLTSQPDFAEISISYIPDKLCVELKSLKMYFWSFRDRGVFHEAVTNDICDHIVDKIQPRYLEVKAKFLVRGGLTTTVIATHGKN